MVEDDEEEQSLTVGLYLNLPTDVLQAHPDYDSQLDHFCRAVAQMDALDLIKIVYVNMTGPTEE
jgi:hypothetical protein